MTQEKHCSKTTDIPEDVLLRLLSDLYGLEEKSKSPIAASCRFFGFGAFQTQRIKFRLFKYLYQGKQDRIDSLLKIRPDFASKVPELYQFASGVPELYKKVLFTLASTAEQDKMQPLLKKHPKLLLEYGPLTDISGAHFKNITLFQHAVWAGDVRYMCGMMLDCLPKNKLGEQIRLDLVGQFNDLMNDGVVYELEGKEHIETQFSLRALIEALRTYDAGYADWSDEERKHHWCTRVGASQNYLPAHVRHHYCNEEEYFYPIIPSFTKVNLVRSLKIMNFTNSDYAVWDSSLQGLGTQFGILNNTSGGGRAVPWRTPYGEESYTDLSVIEALYEVRTNTDLPALKQRLESPISCQDEIPDSMSLTC